MRNTLALLQINIATAVKYPNNEDRIALDTKGNGGLSLVSYRPKVQFRIDQRSAIWK